MMYCIGNAVQRVLVSAFPIATGTTAREPGWRVANFPEDQICDYVRKVTAVKKTHGRVRIRLEMLPERERVALLQALSRLHGSTDSPESSLGHHTQLREQVNLSLVACGEEICRILAQILQKHRRCFRLVFIVPIRGGWVEEFVEESAVYPPPFTIFEHPERPYI